MSSRLLYTLNITYNHLLIQPDGLIIGDGDYPTEVLNWTSG